MCRFKSGIILNKKIILAEGGNESHSAILEKLGIEDNYINASKTFVRAELIPKDEAWWVDPDAEPDKWEFVVDQDITPEWFSLDKQKYEADFRKAVCGWWKEHIFVDKKIDTLSDGYYRLKRCEVKKLLKNVQVLLISSTVQEMCDNSTVQEMHDSSTVQEMYDRSTVQEMRGSSTVQKMYDRSTVQEMYGSSTVREMYGSSMARNFKNHPDIKVYVAKGGRFKMIIFKNEEDGVK